MKETLKANNYLIDFIFKNSFDFRTSCI